MPTQKKLDLRSESSNRILLGPPGMLLAATCFALMLGVTCAMVDRSGPLAPTDSAWTATEPDVTEWTSGFLAGQRRENLSVEIEGKENQGKESPGQMAVSR